MRAPSGSLSYRTFGMQKIMQSQNNETIYSTETAHELTVIRIILRNRVSTESIKLLLRT